jgi:hypothetical protein
VRKPRSASLIAGLLEAMLDPVSHAIANAPADNEPVTGEDLRRLREGQAWFAQRGGKGIPMEDVLAECGLTPEDFPVSTENAK